MPYALPSFLKCCSTGSADLVMDTSDSHTAIPLFPLIPACPMLWALAAPNTGGSRLSRIFWEHTNLSGLSVIWLISTNLH